MSFTMYVMQYVAYPFRVQWVLQDMTCNTVVECHKTGEMIQ